MGFNCWDQRLPVVRSLARGLPGDVLCVSDGVWLALSFVKPTNCLSDNTDNSGLFGQSRVGFSDGMGPPVQTDFLKLQLRLGVFAFMERANPRTVQSQNLPSLASEYDGSDSLRCRPKVWQLSVSSGGS